MFMYATNYAKMKNNLNGHIKIENANWLLVKSIIKVYCATTLGAI